MPQSNVGFIGFGTVGKTFARILLDHGAAVCYYDVHGPVGAEVPGLGAPGTHYLPLPELIAGCDLLISAVVTHVALEAAQAAAPYLGPGKTYVDLNSTSPQTKVSIGDCVSATGASFVDAALLGPANAAVARAPILLAGQSAETVVPVFLELGLSNARYLSGQYGDAATVKMLRSVFTKGAECLMIEMLAAARRLGRDELMWREMASYMAENPFEKMAANWVKTHVMACERREHEMMEVVATLEEAGIEPLMSRATQAFFARSVALQPGEAFEQAPESVGQVAEFFAERL